LRRDSIRFGLGAAAARAPRPQRRRPSWPPQSCPPGLAGLLVKGGAQVLVLDTGSLGAAVETGPEGGAAEVEAEASGEAQAAPAECPSPLQQLMAWLGAPRCPSRSTGCATGSSRAAAEAAPAAADNGSAQQPGAAPADGPEPPVGHKVSSGQPCRHASPRLSLC
jgi:hypothetical protein